MDPTTIAQILAARAQPARPVTATPPTAQDLSRYLYGTFPATAGDPAADLPIPMQPPQPLPSWLPQNVQDYIRFQPSYVEGQAQGPRPNIAGGEPYSPTPQIDDIRRLFSGSIHQNAPTSAPSGLTADQLRALYRIGFSGGTNI